MKKLYEKSKIWFAVVWIILYVVGTSLVENLSESIGQPKLLTLVFHAAMTLVILLFLKGQKAFREYGLCKAKYSAKSFLFYIPLIAVSTVNFWYGVKMNMPIPETVFYVLSMVCVGFLEEIIFRGFLFKAMAKDGLTSAIIVSSVTFGIGHIVNLINGSGAELIPNLCQVVYAIAFGYLCVILFHRGGSLIPCIAAHSFVNATSAFQGGTNPTRQLISAAVLTVVPLVYAIILQKTLPKETEKAC